ncbi:MAG: hypothetical protein D6705_16155 [Deltaproteobacteria bacterium]|nr:MAG: hypothetical protein D6705_16155 [Deltaproteobacteria bacterium]
MAEEASNPRGTPPVGEPLDWPRISAWVLGAHAILPPALAGLARIDPAVPLATWLAIHLGWPVVLWTVRRRLAGHWVDAGILCAAGHVVTAVSGALTAVALG